MTESDTTREALEPCPWCASDKVSTRRGLDSWVYCSECACEGPKHLTMAEAIAAWNRRASAPPLSDEALRKGVAGAIDVAFSLGGEPWARQAAVSEILALFSDRLRVVDGEHMAEADSLRDGAIERTVRAQAAEAALATAQGRIAEMEGACTKALQHVLGLLDTARAAATFTKPQAGRVIVNVVKMDAALDELRRAFAHLQASGRDGGC